MKVAMLADLWAKKSHREKMAPVESWTVRSGEDVWLVMGSCGSWGIDKEWCTGGRSWQSERLGPRDLYFYSVEDWKQKCRNWNRYGWGLHQTQWEEVMLPGKEWKTLYSEQMRCWSRIWGKGIASLLETNGRRCISVAMRISIKYQWIVYLMRWRRSD